MNLTINMKTRVPVKLTALGVLSLLLLTSCGSYKTETASMTWCGFSYTKEKTHEIYPRVIVMDTTVLGVQVDYNETMKLPCGRVGLIHNMWIVDSSGGSETWVTYLLKSFFFTKSNSYHIASAYAGDRPEDTTIYQDDFVPDTNSLLEAEGELLFDPSAEATE